MTDINKIKKAIQTLVELSENKANFSDDDWSIDHQLDLDDSLRDGLAKLQIELNLLMDAVQQKDLITAKCALVTARVISLDLSNFFLNIFEDIEKVGWSKELNLPSIPEGYQIPEHYTYPHR